MVHNMKKFENPCPLLFNVYMKPLRKSVTKHRLKCHLCLFYIASMSDCMLVHWFPSQWNKRVRQPSISCGPFFPGSSFWELIKNSKRTKTSRNKTQTAIATSCFPIQTCGQGFSSPSCLPGSPLYFPAPSSMSGLIRCYLHPLGSALSSVLIPCHTDINTTWQN